MVLTTADFPARSKRRGFIAAYYSGRGGVFHPVDR
jgi:hypothetical protein